MNKCADEEEKEVETRSQVNADLSATNELFRVSFGGNTVGRGRSLNERNSGAKKIGRSSSTSNEHSLMKDCGHDEVDDLQFPK
jgi:hypothetical protein